MLDGIKEEAVGFLFNLEVQVEEGAEEEAGGVTEAGSSGAVGQPAEELTAEEFAAQVDRAAAAVATPEAGGHIGIRAKGLGGSHTPQNLQYSQPVIDGEAGSGGVEIGRDSSAGGSALRAGPASAIAAGEKRPAAGQKVGSGPSRNAPCPCGSGRKYKRCHGAPDAGPLPG